MISDVLFDAVREIEEYQRSLPGCYDFLRDEIGKVTVVMDSLRAYLDMPPSEGGCARYEAARNRLRDVIARIDVGGVLAALEDVPGPWPTAHAST